MLAIDQAEQLLEMAERRRTAAGAENGEFRRADARAFTDHAPFKAIVERLLLFHLPDRADVLRRQMDSLRCCAARASRTSRPLGIQPSGHGAAGRSTPERLLSGQPESASP